MRVMHRPVRMDGVGDVAASFHAVVPALRAADCGVDSADLDRLRRQSVLRRALPGVDVVHGSVPTWHQRLAVVAAAVGGRAVISHRSAARLHGVDGFERDIIEVSVPRGSLAHIDTSVFPFTRHQVSRPWEPDDLTIVDGLSCTSIERTMVDLVDVVDRRLAERALDHFERRGHSLERLAEVAERLRRPGVRGPRFVLSEVERRLQRGAVSGSWFEKLVERCVRSPKLPEPVPQYVIRDRRGVFIARVDLAFPTLRLAIEAHSRSFHAAVSDGVIDQRRENRALVEGWQFTYIGWGDQQSPARVCRFIEQVAAVRARDLGLPPG